ncbi:MAG: biotin/lipoyl-binding protein, partial [Aldersonia sp.]|nr:biotin/lipoyl-binding protein [Aldersonia sp.]
AQQRAASRVLAGVTSGFRNNPAHLQTREYRLGDDTIHVGYRLGADPRFEVNGEFVDARVVSATTTSVDLIVDRIRRRFTVSEGHANRLISWSGGSVEFTDAPRFPDATEAIHPGSMMAPMPGTVSRVEVTVGDRVNAGSVVLVLEAMKMEHPIVADTDSVVTEVPVGVGQPVNIGEVLIVLDTETAEAK